MNILEFNNVTKNIYNFHLKPTNIVLKDGEILGIVGKPGSGKTTLSKLITNFYRPKKGHITIFGLDSVKDSKEIKMDLSVIPQSNWFGDSQRPMSLLKNSLRSRKLKNYDEINFLLDYFDVKLSSKIGNMSHHDKRKLAVINGLVSNSRIIIVDEPESITTPGTRLKLYDILEEKNREGSSIIIFFSSLKEAQSICDNIYYLHNGEIIEEEDQSKKLSNDKILKFYDKNFDREIFDSIGAKLVKTGPETSYYYNGPLEILSEAIYRSNLVDYTLEDSTLDEKLTIIEKEISLRRTGSTNTPIVNENKPLINEPVENNITNKEINEELDDNSQTLIQKKEDFLIAEKEYLNEVDESDLIIKETSEIDEGLNTPLKTENIELIKKEETKWFFLMNIKET